MRSFPLQVSAADDLEQVFPKSRHGVHIQEQLIPSSAFSQSRYVLVVQQSPVPVAPAAGSVAKRVSCLRISGLPLKPGPFGAGQMPGKSAHLPRQSKKDCFSLAETAPPNNLSKRHPRNFVILRVLIGWRRDVHGYRLESSI